MFYPRPLQNSQFLCFRNEVAFTRSNVYVFVRLRRNEMCDVIQETAALLRENKIFEKHF